MIYNKIHCRSWCLYDLKAHAVSVDIPPDAAIVLAIDPVVPLFLEVAAVVVRDGLDVCDVEKGTGALILISSIDGIVGTIVSRLIGCLGKIILFFDTVDKILDMFKKYYYLP